MSLNDDRMPHPPNPKVKLVVRKRMVTVVIRMIRRTKGKNASK